jgi:limonene-1,2-epoxide hydrolase
MKKLIIILVFLLSILNIQAQANKTVTEPIQAYIDAWKEKDNTARLAIIKSFWTKESYYNDPVANVKGPEDLNAMIGKFQNDFPNAILTNDAILQNDNFRSWN